MGINFESAKKSLNISSSQFDQLDKLDNKADQQIEESIFEMAKNVRNAEERSMIIQMDCSIRLMTFYLKV